MVFRVTARREGPFWRTATVVLGSLLKNFFRMGERGERRRSFWAA